MMLMAGKRITRSLHEILSGSIKCTNTIDDYMHMNIACRVVSVGVCTDKCLMPREVLLGKFHAESLSLFWSQSIVIIITHLIQFLCHSKMEVHFLGWWEFFFLSTPVFFLLLVS